MASYTTIEQTRKSIKAQSFLGFLTTVFGIALLTMSRGVENLPDKQATMGMGFLTILGGATWMLGMRIAKWWHHD